MLTRDEAETLKKLIDEMTENEAIVTNETVVEPLSEVDEGETVPELEVKEPVEITESDLKKMFRGAIPEGFTPEGVELVRSPKTGDRVFLKFGDERRWIPDPETVERLGYSLGDVKDISDEEISELKEGFGLLSAKLW